MLFAGQVPEMTLAAIIAGAKMGGAAEKAALAAYAQDTATGDPATFTDGADNIPIVSLIADILPTQEGAGDPTPTNPRPIVADEEIELTVNGDTIPVTWEEAGIVYKGNIDVVSGLITVTHKIVDMGNLNWSYNSTYGVMRATTLNDVIAESTSGVVPDMYCTYYTVISSRGIADFTGEDLVITTRADDSSICAKDTNYTNKDTFKTAVTGQKIVYPLKTPETVQVDGKTIKTILGSNSFASDSGDVTVVYRADTALYIDKKLNP